MYTENFSLLSFKDFIKNKFPDSKLTNNYFETFTSFEDEKNIIKNGVALRIIENPTFIKLNGKDTIDFLHRISTNDLKNLQENQKINTLFLNEKGKFISRSTFIRFNNENYLLSEPDQDNRLFNWINKFIIMEDITLENLTNKFSLLEFFGPQSNSFLTLLIGDEIKNLTEFDYKRFDVDGFTFYMFIAKENNNVEVYKLIIETTRLIDFYQYLDSIKSVFDLQLIGELAYDYFRVKNLIPKFPNEINSETNPYEVNLIHEVNFKKGCYIGQEVIARLDTYDKVQRKLIKAELNNKSYQLSKLDLINEENLLVGKITTEHLELFPQFMCLVKRNLLNGNNTLKVNIENQERDLILIES
ncbi:MAG: hypothetical protein N2321_07435 [Melioribacteraceae bacterium]|nr:hypothetical protein [Melioribacteraceae bacterium]